MSSARRWRSWDQRRGSRRLKCVRARLQKNVCIYEGKMLHLISSTRREAGRSAFVTTQGAMEEMWERTVVHFPNLQPIDWALAEFTRPLYLHFLKLDKPVPVPKEHFGNISGRAAKIAGMKRHRLWKWADICILPLISIAYSVYTKCWHARWRGGVWFYLHRGSCETRIIG